jgi:hypothetical protein|tara:strand:- start:4169 stop:5917 length:1749 start_codon:yes stop_codon:yes gene_type:complete
MKKGLRLFYVLFIAISIQLSVNAQEPVVPEHEKKVYLNDGNTYVQKSLPLYFKFSTSPGGQQYDLTSKLTSKYANPMYLDTEGINYMRSRYAVNPETKKTIQPQQEVMYELYADGLAPVTRLKYDGAPRYRSDRLYFGKSLTYTLTSRDGVSGVEKIHSAVNSTTWSDYSATSNLDKEGEFNLSWYAHDNVGNAEALKSDKFVVDLSAPTSNHTIVGIVYNGTILAPSTKFNLAKTDNLSGVNRTKFSFDGRAENAYGGNFGVAYLKDGEHTLYYYSIDNVKNTEEKQAFKFYLDKIPPVVTHTINGDEFKGSNGVTYVSNRTTVSLAATDNKAGVNKIYHRTDQKDRFDYSSEIEFPDVRGSHSVKYDATDNVQNLSLNKYVNVYMDNVKPTTGIRYGSPQFFARDTLYINKTTAIKLFSKDYESGVQKMEYQIDGSGYKTYSEFAIPNDGYHSINFKTTDNVNNEEQEKTSNCFVDNIAPEIYNNFSIQPIGNKKELKVYPNYTRLYLGATDDHVGTESIMYSINDAPLALYSSAQTLDISERNRFLKKKVKYTVKVVSKDKLGNTSEKIIEFYVGLATD